MGVREGESQITTYYRSHRAWRAVRGPAASIMKKAPLRQRGFNKGRPNLLRRLLQSGFLVFDVLASHGIKLFDHHFLGRVALVFSGRVEMTCARCGFQF